LPAVFATARCGRHATRQNPSPRRPTEARVQLLLCPTAILADARLTPTEFARPGHRHSHHAVIRWAIPMGPCVNRAGGGRASVPHCGCRLPAIYMSRVSSRQTRNFGFGQSSQSQLRLRHRPQKARVPCTPCRLRGSAEGPSVSLRRARGIRPPPLPGPLLVCTRGSA
jgi:hypothetical protein